MLLFKLFVRRMVHKYIIRDFHPLVLFYLFGAVLFLIDLPLVIRFFTLWAINGNVPPITALAIIFVTLLGFQSLLFAMLFDMEANKALNGL
jgi:hypothetical protein